MIETRTPVVEVPPLQAGDHLSRAEFERRYRAMPGVKKAELVEGVVYMHSPVSLKRHAAPHFKLNLWLGTYSASTPGVEGGDNATVRLDLDNEPQPDAFLRILPEHGGQSRTSGDDYVDGAPELIAEVAGSSASYDLHAKLAAYRRNGVPEYLVWRTWDQELDWFVLLDDQFVRLAPDADGRLASRVFPGLVLDPAAMLAGEMAKVLAVLQQGLARPEHAAFVARLAAARRA